MNLKPCPFCGGEAEIINRSVHCNSPRCNAQPYTSGPTQGEAVAAWNRRAPAEGKQQPESDSFHQAADDAERAFASPLPSSRQTDRSALPREPK